MASSVAAKMGSAVAFSAANAGSTKQSSIAQPFVGLKAGAALPIAKKAATFSDKTVSNSGRVQCMKVSWCLKISVVNWMHGRSLHIPMQVFAVRS